MSLEQDRAETVSLLQDLGLQEYEARCFLALSQLPSGTAKEISDVSEVPRTRVYDAVRVLEAQGLVEVQHSNPKRFRAVSVGEATETLRQKYDARIDTLRSYLDEIEREEAAADDDRMQEVWSLSGHGAIESRTIELLDSADSEIVLLVVQTEILTEELFDAVERANERGVDVIFGGSTDDVVDRIESAADDAEVYETGLDWLVGVTDGSEVAISRLLLVDRTRLLVSSYYPSEQDGEESHEQAVFATGLGNGMVVLIRRLVASGLAAERDPGR